MKEKLKIDFIGIGAAKSGTTWLAKMLYQHPEICVSEPKEVSYFNRELSSNATVRFKHKKGPFLNKNHDKPFSWYKRHFACYKEGRVVGEYSPVYFYDPQARFLIKKYFPEVKLIVLLRNPIDRAYSEYWMFRSSFKIEDRTFDEAIRQKGTMYIQKGLFYQQLKAYFELFEREQFKIVFHDDVKDDPEKILKEVYNFLGVDDSFVPPDINRRSNYAKETRIKGSIWWMNSVVKFLVQMRMTFLIRFLRKISANTFMLKILARKSQYPPMSTESREYLRKVFEKDIESLEHILKKDLSHWK